MCIKHEKAISANLTRWQQSSQPWRWVVAHQGSWNHADWLKLLAELEGSEFWPMIPAEVGRVLEELKVCFQNLKRWKESGHPAWWVASREGAWSHGDWDSLMDLLRRSEYWPLHPAAVGELVEELKVRYQNLRRWQDSGAANRWVEEHSGVWNHEDWLTLLAELQQSSFWPLPPEEVGRVLEEAKLEFRNLQRWQESCEPQLWVETRGRDWSHDDWTDLLDQLQTSDYWPLNPVMVGHLLEQIKTEVQTAWSFFDANEPEWGQMDSTGDFLFFQQPRSWSERVAQEEIITLEFPAPPPSLLPLHIPRERAA